MASLKSTGTYKQQINKQCVNAEKVMFYKNKEGE